MHTYMYVYDRREGGRIAQLRMDVGRTRRSKNVRNLSILIFIEQYARGHNMSFGKLHHALRNQKA